MLFSETAERDDKIHYDAETWPVIGKDETPDARNN
jgi:hypothetical protein